MNASSLSDVLADLDLDDNQVEIAREYMLVQITAARMQRNAVGTLIMCLFHVFIMQDMLAQIGDETNSFIQGTISLLPYMAGTVAGVAVLSILLAQVVAGRRRSAMRSQRFSDRQFQVITDLTDRVVRRQVFSIFMAFGFKRQ